MTEASERDFSRYLSARVLSVLGVVSVVAGDPRAGLGAGVEVLLAGVVTAWVSPVLRRAA